MQHIKTTFVATKSIIHSDDSEHTEICSRMEWYFRSQTIHTEQTELQIENVEENVEVDKTDPILFISKLQDMIKNPDVDFCICERENICDCKDECACDSDDYGTVNKIDIIDGSNCQCLIEIRIGGHSLKAWKNIRLFSLNKKTDEEEVIIDIIRYVMNKKVIETWIQFDWHDPPIRFAVDEGAKLKDGILRLNFNYMQWEKVVD